MIDVMDENLEVVSQANNRCLLGAGIDNLEADNFALAFDKSLQLRNDINEEPFEENTATGKLYHQAHGASMNGQKCLGKCPTFPSKSRVSPMIEKDEMPQGKVMHDANSVRASNPCLRSFSFPPSTALVSAMKGGRRQRGMPEENVKLSVTWAPDVYDPPSSSLCHTVKGNHGQRTRGTSAKKDTHKHRQKKGSKSICGYNNRRMSRTRS